MLTQLNFLAGIALMLFGIRSLRRGADRMFGARLRKLLQTATQGRWRALMAGFWLSILIPSSTGVALLSVEAIHAGYVTLPQVLAVMLGANIGFTVTVQLLAFKFYIYYAAFLVIGIPVYVFGSRQQLRGAGQMVAGIGFLLLAIQILSAAVLPLKESADVRDVMAVLERHPVWMVGFALLLKVLLQSATATIGIAIALCQQGVLPATSAVAVVVGANLGIGVTALIAGFARLDTRRMAIGNLMFKVVGAVAVLPFLTGVTNAVAAISPAGSSQVAANAYSLFNIALAVVFLPLVPAVARGVERLIPERAEEKPPGSPRHLDPRYLESPALALGQATQEILHMAEHVRGMLRDAHRAFLSGDEKLCEQVQQHDDMVDNLNNEIKGYITRMSEKALRPEESRREVALLAFANELESAGDIIDKNLIELAKKKISLHVDFSKEGLQELEGYFQKVLENFEIAVAAFASQDKELAEQLLRHKHHLNETERELRNRHFHRLHAGLIESIETSAIHLDVLTNLKRINSHLTAVAYPILENHG